MRSSILFAAITTTVLALGLGSISAGLAPTTEVYATASDGTPLHWIVYQPSGTGPWPVVLIIHGGGFYKNTPDSSQQSVACGQDLANAGYIAFSIEYRLAPPGALAAQVSHGRFPDQTDDVKLAVRTARADPRCNGQVAAVGGSAGGSHTAYVAGTGTAGDDRIDGGVDLSGAHDFSDFNPGSNINLFTSNVTNYVGVMSDDIAALRAASPAWTADKATTPLLLVNTLQDAMPYAQQSDMVQHLDALGVTNYQVVTLPGHAHSFAIWPDIKEKALAFIADVFAGGPAPSPTPLPDGAAKKLINVSTRANVGMDDNVMVGGFIVTGETSKRVVLRGVGPSLQTVGLSGSLPDPFLELYDSAGELVEGNDNWVAIPGIANPLLPSDPSESFLMAWLPPGSYTAVLHGATQATGIGLVELYDTDPANARISNISTRGQVGAGDGEMIGGFIVGGSDPTRVIVRALGPSLAAAGITGVLPNPMLELRDANGTLLGQNDDWRSDQEQLIIASAVPPSDDKEAAILATLLPGSYTALVHDAKIGSGIALVEAYDLEPEQ